MTAKTHTFEKALVSTASETDKERTKEKKRFNLELLPTELNNCFQKSINSCFVFFKIRSEKTTYFRREVPLAITLRTKSIHIEKKFSLLGGPRVTGSVKSNFVRLWLL